MLEINIYQDLDGCIVDWTKGYKNKVRETSSYILQKYNITEKEFEEMTPKEFEEKYLMDYYLKKFFMNYKKAKNAAKGAFWKPIQGDKDFWINLDWMPDGKELVNYLVELKKNGKITTLNVLSAPSSDPVCKIGKLEWLEKHGLTKIFDNIILENDKSKYAQNNKNNILIDDTEKKIKGFIDAGGTGVFHTNAAETIQKLKQLGL